MALRLFGASGSFGGRVLTVASGTIVGQAVVLAAAPFLTRLYSPSDWGILAVYSSFLSFFHVAASLRYELAIPVPDDDEEAFALLVLSGMLVMGTGTVALFAVAVAGGWLGRAFAELSRIGTLAWLIPLGVVWSGWNKALTYWAIRKQEFSSIGRTKLVQGVGQATAQLGMGAAVSGATGLVVGDIVGRAGGTYPLARVAWRSSRQCRSEFRWNLIKVVGHRFRDFPLFSTPAALLNTGGLRLPAILIAALFGAGSAGWFGLCQTIAAGPLSLIGRPVSQVFAGEITEAVRDGRPVVSTRLMSIARRLFLWSVGPSAVVAVLAPTAFGWAFGEEWRGAGVLLRILMPMLLAQVVVFPLSLTLTVLEEQRWQLAWDAGRLLAVAGALIIPSILGWTFLETAAVFSAAMSLCYVVLLGLSYTAALGRDKALRHAA